MDHHSHQHSHTHADSPSPTSSSASQTHPHPHPRSIRNPSVSSAASRKHQRQRSSYSLAPPGLSNNGYTIPSSRPSVASHGHKPSKSISTEPFSAIPPATSRSSFPFSLRSITTPLLLSATLLLTSLAAPTEKPVSELNQTDVKGPVYTPDLPFARPFFSRCYVAAIISSGALLLGGGLQWGLLSKKRRSAASVVGNTAGWGKILSRALTVWVCFLAGLQLGGLRASVLVAGLLAGGIIEGGFAGLANMKALGVSTLLMMGWDVWRDTKDWGIVVAYLGVITSLAGVGGYVWPNSTKGEGRVSCGVTVWAGGVLGVVAGLGWMFGAEEPGSWGALMGCVCVGGMLVVLGTDLGGEIGAGVASLAAIVGSWGLGGFGGWGEGSCEVALAAVVVAAVRYDSTPTPTPSSHSHSHSHAATPSTPPKPPSAISLYLISRTTSHPLLHSLLLSPSSRRILYFLLLNFTFMLLQTSYGYLTNSLGLISDSIHMFFDCLALLLGLLASSLSKHPPTLHFPYGLSSIDTLAGFANGVFLMLISVEIVWEAIDRLSNPTPLDRLLELLFVAIGGLVVNLIGILAFDHAHVHGHSHSHDGGDGHSDNLHGIFLHILADLLGSVSVVASTILIHYTGWSGFDPLASVLIAVLIFVSSVPLVKSAAGQLLLAVEPGLEYELRETISGISGVRGVEGVRCVRFWVAGEMGEAEGKQDHDDHGHGHGHGGGSGVASNGLGGLGISFPDEVGRKGSAASMASCNGDHDHGHGQNHSHSHENKRTSYAGHRNSIYDLPMSPSPLSQSFSFPDDNEHGHGHSHNHGGHSHGGRDSRDHSHSHSHDSHAHNHGHSHDHSAGDECDSHDHGETKKAKGRRVKGVVHVIRARGESREEVRRRIEDFVGDKAEVVVQVEDPEEEGLGEKGMTSRNTCWCRDGTRER